MATIYERKNQDGSSSYRIQIRRKGLPKFSATFCILSEAMKFVNDFEEKYCLDPHNFTFDRLKRIRENEFYRN